MSPITPVTTATDTAVATGRQSQALTSEDFMKIMITELTHQDPFEPMKNQDLLNQMATIQQMESNQGMSKSFKDLMARFDQLLLRDELAGAGRMVGQMVSGKNASGQAVYGKVIAVNVSEGNVMLELDTGDLVRMTEVGRLGGQNSDDIIHQVVKGTTLDGRQVVGIVQSMDVDDKGIVLNLKTRNSSGEEIVAAVPMGNASLLNKDSVGILLGNNVEGYVEKDGAMKKIKGQALSFRLEESGLVTLYVKDGDQEAETLPLTAVTGVTSATSS